MDNSANVKNTGLYNSHANKHASTREALEARQQSESAPLRKLHNKIKRLLLQRFATGAERLLDVACGRGGDLNKWIDCKVAYVKGYDIAEQEVAEARARLAEALQRIPGLATRFTAEFEYRTDVGDRVWDEGASYDVITCMFAWHYFFSSEASAKNAIELVARNLKHGGYFLGVLPNGKHVQDTIGPTMKPRELAMLRLCPKWKGPPQPFGSAYTCAIARTVTEGGEEGEGSYEYLVFQKVFVGLAREFDLHPVIDYEDFELDEVLQPAETSSDGARLFRRFQPRFVGAKASLTLASKLNSAFVFRKGVREDVDGGATVASSAAPRKRAGDDRDDSETAPRNDALDGAHDEDSVLEASRSGTRHSNVKPKDEASDQPQNASRSLRDGERGCAGMQRDSASESDDAERERPARKEARKTGATAFKASSRMYRKE